MILSHLALCNLRVEAAKNREIDTNHVQLKYRNSLSVPLSAFLDSGELNGRGSRSSANIEIA